MKNPFKKTVKSKTAIAKTISKTELKNIVGGTDDSAPISGLKITAERPSAFFHS